MSGGISTATAIVLRALLPVSVGSLHLVRLKNPIVLGGTVGSAEWRVIGYVDRIAYRSVGIRVQFHDLFVRQPGSFLTNLSPLPI
ncbi:hypothetical protein [Burkholderia sp. BCC0322]|uniref:hypothetical protein n=1 Tax=unclassified Burkholderia TaxID=2613784 RepID=UPI00158A6D16|nr:hypothetical protein [Burkholderia sp. BCC0322]